MNKINKYILIYSIILIILYIFCNNIYAQIPTTGLIAHYPFNGNVNDISGSGNNGIIHGGVGFTSDRLGNANSAALFNGTNGWIEIPSTNTIKFNYGESFSFFFILKADPNYGNSSAGSWNQQAIFSRYSCPQMSSSGCYTYNNGIFIYIDSNIQSINCQVSEDLPTGAKEVEGAICPLFSNYHSVVVVRDATDSLLSIWIDGVLKQQKAYPPGINNCNLQLWIGKTVACNGGLPDWQFLKGTIDEMAIYNRVLTTTEIQTISIPAIPNIIPDFVQLGSYCVGETAAALPVVSTNGVSGSWLPSTINTNTSGNTVYHFTPNVGQCADPVDMTITVKPKPIGIITPLQICSNEFTGIVLNSDIPSTFTWSIGTITNGITGATSGSGLFINQQLINPGTITGTVEYIVIPTSNTTACIGNPYTITVDVKPSITPNTINNN